MFVTRRSPLMLALSLPLLQATDPAGGGGNTPPADEVKFDDKHQAKLNDIVAAARKDAEEKAFAKAAADAQATQDKAAQDAKVKADEDKGAYETAKATLEKERNEALTARDSLKGENEIYAKHFEAQYEARVKAVPETVWAELKPADDAPLTERLAAIEKAEKIAALVTSDKKPANPSGTRPLPTSSGNGPTFDEQVDRQRRKSAYS